VERSITAEQLVEESKDEFAGTGGPPKMLRMDNGPEFVCQVLQQFYDSKMLRPDIPPGAPWNNGHIESLNNALRKDCLDRNHWNTLFEAPWSSAASRTRTMTDTATQRWATVRPPSTPRRAGAPTPQWPARSTESGSNEPDSNSGWTWYGDSRGATATNSSAATTTPDSVASFCAAIGFGVSYRVAQ
jgi:hypothetical protein